MKLTRRRLLLAVASVPLAAPLSMATPRLLMPTGAGDEGATLFADPTRWAVLPLYCSSEELRRHAADLGRMGHCRSSFVPAQHDGGELPVTA